MRQPSVTAIVPVKELSRAKLRLSRVLEAPQRRALCVSMLEAVLRALVACRAVSQTLVISGDDEVLSLASLRGCQSLRESSPGLNGALQEACDVARETGAGAVLVLPADVPLVQPDDLRTLIAEASAERSVVVVPSRGDGGTNALLLKPPGVIPFRFGPGSFSEHLLMGQKALAEVKIVRLARLGLDVDTPQDLRDYERWLSGSGDASRDRPRRLSSRARP